MSRAGKNSYVLFLTMSLAKCIRPSGVTVPPIFTDTTGLTIQFDNLGLARVSFVVIHSSDSIGGGSVSFSINNRRFTGVIDSIIPSEIEGTSFKESRVTFVGFAC